MTDTEDDPGAGVVPDPPKPLVFADITAHESRYHHGGFGQSEATMAKPAVQAAARTLVAAMEAFSLECEIAQTERTLESCQAGVNDAMDMLTGLRRLRS